jgi:hypothetical protein
MFGHKMGEGRAGRKKVIYEDFHNYKCSQNIRRLIKSRRLRWAVYVVCIER